MAKVESDKITILQTIKVTWRTLKDIFVETKFDTSMLYSLIIILSLSPLLSNFIQSQVIDGLVIAVGAGATELGSILTPIIAFIVVGILTQLGWSVFSMFEKRQYYRLSRYFTYKFLAKASQLDLYHYESAEKNNLIQKVRESYSDRPQSTADRTIWLISDIANLIATVGVITLFSPIFSLIIILSTLPGVFVSFKLANESWGIWDMDVDKRLRFWDAASLLSHDKSLMELRIFRTREHLLNITKEIFAGFIGRESNAAQKKAFWESAAVAVSSLGGSLFFIFLAFQVLDGSITVGLLGFYLGAAGSFSHSLQSFFRKISYYYENAKYMSSFYEFMDLENTINSGAIKMITKVAPPRIEFKNVDFTYPDSKKPVFKNLNFTIEPGERIALIGENGAGKTTLIKLLSRFYDVTGGQILIDGVDLRELDLDSWYRKVGILFQDFIKYGFMDAAGNISIGDLEKVTDMTEVVNAAQKSEAASFIDDLEKGYEQVLSKAYTSGTDLSGGQWQRIALARGFFRDAPLIILDEPTSAIDAKAEAAIFDKLYEFTIGKSIIIISHRFSTVRQADKIYVLDEGQIIESGSHEELMSLNGQYHEAFTKQAKAYN